VALYRRNSALNDWPVLEVVGVSAVTAAISYLVRSRGSMEVLTLTFELRRSYLHGELPRLSHITRMRLTFNILVKGADLRVGRESVPRM
jgi:hypothetical protein